MSKRSLKTCESCGRDVWTTRVRGVYCPRCIGDEAEDERREQDRWDALNKSRRDTEAEQVGRDDDK